MDPKIESYIRANRKRYTRDAINQRLVEAGHDRGEIEATWAALETRDPDATVGDRFWGRFLLFVVGVNLAALLLVGLVTGMLIGGGGIFILVVLGVALAIGALLAWGIVALTHPTEMGRGTAMAVGGLVPLLFTFLIAGSCYALVGGLTGGVSGPSGPQGTVEVDLEPPLDLQATGSITCQPPPADAASGWSVFSQELLTPDGRLMYVTADSFAFADGGGDGPSTNLNIGLVQQSESDPPQDWHTGPDSELEADVSPDGLTGTIQFENLTSSTFEEADGLSGTVSWDCTNPGG